MSSSPLTSLLTRLACERDLIQRVVQSFDVKDYDGPDIFVILGREHLGATMDDGHDHRLHFVQAVPLFTGLPEATQHQVVSAAMTRRYQRDERIYGPGDRTGLFIVHRGLVKVHRLTESGAEQLIRLMSPGDFLGETALLEDTTTDHFADTTTDHFADITTDHFAVALQPSELCLISRERFTMLLGRHPSVAVQMLQTVSGWQGTAEQMVSALSGQSVRQRLAQQLLLLADEAGGAAFQLPTTKKELASYLGTTPEILSRRLGALQKAGVISPGPHFRDAELAGSPELPWGRRSWAASGSLRNGGRYGRGPAATR